MLKNVCFVILHRSLMLSMSEVYQDVQLAAFVFLMFEAVKVVIQHM